VKPTLNPVLLYRGSRDGFTPQAFHSNCDGKKRTVTIIKSDSDYVFGGYTASPWKSDNGTYGNDPTAFIFNLRQNGQSNTKKISKVNDTTRAIYNNKIFGPAFGSYEGFNYCDILIGFGIDASNYADFGVSYILPEGYEVQKNNTRSYLAGSFTDWKVDEIEVYQV
jgi:hypothetical protein